MGDEVRAQDAVSAPAARPEAVSAARRALLEGVGAEVASSFPGITRLGGQIVAALYLEDGDNAPGRTMDDLGAELGCSKSNVFSNLRALEVAGVVERRRTAGSRLERWALRGRYPDVIIGAYVQRLRQLVVNKRTLVDKSLSLLGDVQGAEADNLRDKLRDLGRKYTLFGRVFSSLSPILDGPIDLEPLLEKVPPEIFDMLRELAGRARD